jgi:hypothetical protein
VGTAADREQERHEHLEEILDPFSDDPDGHRHRRHAIVVALEVIFRLIAVT